MSHTLDRAKLRWIRNTQTVQARLVASGGHTRGFDYLRLVLALSVVAIHSVATARPTVEEQFWSGSWRPLLCAILPMFFALSGFLVAGSLQRSTTIYEFVVLRVLRIVPALAVEILLSVLIIGTLLTTVPLAQYFADAKFWTYLLNIVGSISYELPGLFIHNPRPNVVNLSLWTVPAELWCYIYLVGLAVLGIARRKLLFIAGALLLPVVFTVRIFVTGNFLVGYALPPGYFLIACFMTGAALHLAREWLPINPVLAILSVAAAAILLGSTSLIYLAALPVAYVTGYLGLLNPRKTLLLSGDYSYGVYLFAFPIQQAFVQLFPQFRQPISVFIFAALVSFVYAVLSWHCVEKQVLRQKRAVVARVNAWAVSLSGQLLQIVRPRR